ncbi:LOW QUALITY PROTEIN: protein FAM50A-like [Chlamydotis macqueenii]
MPSPSDVEGRLPGDTSPGDMGANPTDFQGIPGLISCCTTCFVNKRQSAVGTATLKAPAEDKRAQRGTGNGGWGQFLGNGKNPGVDTRFLPDHNQEEEEENQLQEELHQGREAKPEEIEITFSYWDGSRHRCTVKGNTMQQFPQKALDILRRDFSELQLAGVEQLVYIKEGLIILHHSFIITKAQGKSGPLFNIYNDILLNNATMEKDKLHVRKVVLRSWYEKNKHIFPTSRWEPYDPEKGRS